MLRGPPISTRADTLFPYTPLFRAQAHGFAAIGRAVRTAFDLGLERSAQRGVDGVAHAGRAVVGEVVVAVARVFRLCVLGQRSEEHTSELQSLMRISYAVFCLKQKHPHFKDVHLYDYNTHASS